MDCHHLLDCKRFLHISSLVDMGTSLHRLGAGGCLLQVNQMGMEWSVMELPTVPTWKFLLLIPFLSIGYIVAKLRHTNVELGIDMGTDERKRMMIQCDQLDRIGRGDELQS